MLLLTLILINLSFGKILTYKTYTDRYASFDSDLKVKDKELIKIRYDTERCLISIDKPYFASIFQIDFFDINGFEIGSIFSYPFDNNEEIPDNGKICFEEERSERIRAVRMKAYALVKGDWLIIPSEIDEERIEKLEKYNFSCPSGNYVTHSDASWYCRKFYECDEDEYAISKIECEALPSNAERNKYTGFHCEEGFILFDDECQVKTECEYPNRYKRSTNECINLPSDAHWTGKFTYKCNKGYEDKYNNGTCFEKEYEKKDNEFKEQVLNDSTTTKQMAYSSKSPKERLKSSRFKGLDFRSHDYLLYQREITDKLLNNIRK